MRYQTPRRSNRLRGHTIEAQGIQVVLLGQREDVLQRTGHHNRLMRVAVEGEAREGAAGLHAQGALVGAGFTRDFDEYMDASISEERT